MQAQEIAETLVLAAVVSGERAENRRIAMAVCAGRILGRGSMTADDFREIAETAPAFLYESGERPAELRKRLPIDAEAFSAMAEAARPRLDEMRAKLPRTFDEFVSEEVAAILRNIAATEAFKMDRTPD